MKLSKEETYKQLLYSWLELMHSYPGEMMLPAAWAMKLAEQTRATAESLKGEVIPPSGESPKAE